MTDTLQEIAFEPNPALGENKDQYETAEIDISAALAHWQHSLFSFELLDAKGGVKPDSKLKDGDLQKRQAVRDMLRKGESLPMPLVGLGLIDNLEIPMGREVLSTLALEGYTRARVHVRADHKEPILKLCG